MKKQFLRMTTALVAVMAALATLGGCSHGDQSGTAENQQLTKDRQVKLQSHKAEP